MAKHPFPSHDREKEKITKLWLQNNLTNMKTKLIQNGIAVVSSARKLIFRVPTGPVVTFPEGVTISPYGQNNDSAVIVVLNHVDISEDPKGCWQGADAENGVIIMNGVPEEVALELLDLYKADRSLDGLEKVVARAEELGCKDNYTTSVSFVDDKLSAAGLMLDAYTGIVKRDDRDVCYVARDGDGTIQRLMGGDVKHIDTDEILCRDYVNADGSPIDASALPVV